MEDRTIRTVSGYGTELRGKLKELDLTQAWLAREASLSRQTVSRAINRDELSDMTRARIEEALRGVRGGGVHPALGRFPHPDSNTKAGLAILGDTLCNATDLERWSDLRVAQDMLPLVVRRLIQATVGCSELHVRTNEGVQLSGWDGIVHTERSSPFVPKGGSGWEMSVAKDPRGKAEEDWKTRSTNCQPLRPDEASFVFVTSRRWSDKEKWAREKVDEGPWRVVRVLDADDLAAWLDDAPAVHVWLSIQIDKRPPNVVDLESRWEEWSRETRPRLTSQLVLAGRDRALEAIRQRLLEGAGRTWAIQAESQDEAVACLYSAALALGTEQAQCLFAGSLVVDTADAFRSLISANRPLVLIPTFEAGSLASLGAQAGHIVVVPLDRNALAPKDLVVEVGPVRRQPASTALQGVGMPPSRAREMAGLAHESMSAFRRQCDASPAVRRPTWSKPAEARSVMPALLAGSWNDGSPKDREVVADLGPYSYQELRDTLLPHSMTADPLVRNRGGRWYLISARDAWRLLDQYILPDDLSRFRGAAMSVLGQVKSAYHRPPEQRWMVDVRGEDRDHSNLLREGLAMNLAVMGVHGGAVVSVIETVERVIRDLLQKANGDWRIWASLGENLPLLAEAAPDYFVRAVENGLQGPEPVLANLFAGSGRALFHPRGFHGLMSAMEVLAWSSDHFGFVVPLLARLDRLDPASEFRQGNGAHEASGPRPSSVLKAVFRSWLPETSASLSERLAALDRLRSSHGDAAWCVMRSMLPEPSAVGWPASRPKVREWAPDETPRATWEDRARTTSEIVTRMVDDAGLCGRRWTDLIGRLDRLPAGERGHVVTALENLDRGECNDNASAVIWRAVRSTLDRHRRYKTARWAMPEADLTRLQGVLNRLQPSDPAARFGWLFADVVPQEEKQMQAAAAVFEQGGLSALAALARAVDRPDDLGFAVGSMPNGLVDAHVVLPQYLAHAETALSRFARGFALGRYRAHGKSWVIRQLERGELTPSADQEVALLMVLPFCSETWEVAARRGEAVHEGYWGKVRTFSGCARDQDLAEGASCLVNAGRPFDAASVLAHDQRVTRSLVSAGVIADVLRAIVSADGECDTPNPQLGGDIASLLDMLAAADYDSKDLARLEWGLLPHVSQHERPPGALHEILAEDAAFFVKVVALAYSPEGEDPARLDERTRRIAQGAYSLLSSWRTLPGEDNGRVSHRLLHRWITEAQAGLDAVRRLPVGLTVAGQMLSGSPHGRDGLWPCAAVREVIEAVASTDLETGVAVGVHNSRGVVTKDAGVGGVAERELAQQYEGYAIAARATHPRTARMLRGIAKSYSRDADREDHRADDV